MNAITKGVAALAAEIARLSGEIGRRVVVDEREAIDRSGALKLAAPGLWSPNRSCRLVRSADGWIAANLPREVDRWLVPAWIGCAPDADPWRAVLGAAQSMSSQNLIAQARLLGLPVAKVGELRADSPDADLHRLAAGRNRPISRPMKVVDLSSMWAGPLCGAILADLGASVTKVESRDRPDATRAASPLFHSRLNGAKSQVSLDFANRQDIGWLRDQIAVADIVITSARPRAFEQLDLTPQALFAINPGLVWVAISGYGWMGEAADRVAFGDDAAAAGGLLRWTARGEPRFMGDAAADPLTGLTAAAGALKAVRQGGGILVDAALGLTAAGVAARYAGAEVA